MARELRIRKTVAVLAVLAPLLSILHACSPPPEPPEEPIAVGVLVPLTGSLSVWGINSERGVRLAADTANAAGGIDGRRVELLVEDSACEPDRALAALGRWIDRGDVPVVVGAICSSNVLAMAPIAQREEIVILSTGASNPAISDAGDFIFRNWPSDRIQGHLSADFAIEQGYQSAAILYVDNAYGRGLEEVFRERFLEHGGAIALSPPASYSEGDDEFRAQLERIRDSGADLLYLPAYTREYPLILEQARALGLGIPIVAAETFDDPETIARSGAAAEGVVFPSPGSVDRTTPRGRGFVEAFERAFGEPPGITSDAAFDAMHLIVLALSGGARTGPQIQEFLDVVEGYQGVTGVVEFDSSGDAGKEIAFYTVSGGRAEPLDRRPVEPGSPH